MSFRRIRRTIREIGQEMPEGLALCTIVICCNFIATTGAFIFVNHVSRACALDLMNVLR